MRFQKEPVVVLKGAHFKGLRWVLLCMAIVGAFGFEYSFDTPSALKELMHEFFAKKYSEKKFEIFYSLLYSIMALPNIFLPLVLGLLVDKFGVRINFAWMALGVAIGTVIIYSGIKQLNFTLLYFGRVVVGASGESLHIIEGLFLREYFSPDQMSFVIALVECSLHMGGVINAIVSPRIAVHDFPKAFKAGVFLCFFNAAIILIACIVDKVVEVKNKKRRSELESRMGILEEEPEETEFLTDPKLAELAEGIEPEEIEEAPSKWEAIKIYFSNISKFHSIYWYVTFAGAITLPTILSFMMISTSYITKKKGGTAPASESAVESAGIASLFRITAALSSPFLGFAIDKIGNRAVFLLAGAVLSFVTQILAIFSPPMMCCIFFGLAYALIATTMWPSVYVIVKKDMLGIATGIVNATDNLGIFIYPIIVSLIKNEMGSYDYSQVFLTIMGFIATLSAIRVLYMTKTKRGSVPRLTPQPTFNDDYY